jgi:hypothetical protein
MTVGTTKSTARGGYIVNLDGTGIANVTNTTGVIECEADWETLTAD